MLGLKEPCNRPKNEMNKLFAREINRVHYNIVPIDKYIALNLRFEFLILKK